MQVEEIHVQHPLAVNDDENLLTANNGQKKNHRRRGRGSQRKSSVIVVEDTLLVDSVPHARRKSSSNARYFSKCHEEQDDSPALNSLKDIISEMKRLPTISSAASNDTLNTSWKGVRRHSEPPNKHQINKSVTLNESRLTPITENVVSKPIFSNSFLALDEEEKQGENTTNIEILVSPLFANDLTMPLKRTRSQSVPNTINPDLSVGRKSLYPAHLTVSDASALIRTRVLYSGILKVDLQDSSEANVECDELDASIYIFGSRNRNRALDGDEVAVQLVNVNDMLNERKTKRQVRQTRRLSVISQSSSHLSSIPEDTINIESEIGSMKSKPKYCGKVVCILERPKNMLFSGTLSLNRPHAKLLDNSSRDKRDSSHPKIIWFIPADKRLPLVAVPIKFAPPDFIKYHEEYKNRIFIGNIQRWPASSLHPFGTIEKEIGWMGELSVHSAALMADHHIKDMNFPESVLKAANAIPQSLTPHDKKGRRDLTDDYIFTLDPSSNYDVDCAFSIQLSEDGIYDVGIHISDVAHFVRLLTPLDREARERSCSVNLVDRTISTLPPSFTKQHCSLEVDQERLAYSVLFRITSKGVLLHAWVGKTNIQVKENLAPEAQMAKELLQLCEKIQMNRLTKLNGLSLSQSYETFMLAESGYPKEIHRVDQSDHDVLIQELLILANMEVGQKICSRFPDQALLYRQDSPKLSKFAMIQDYFKSDPLTNSVQGLMELVDQKETSLEKQKALAYLIRKLTPPSKYFSAGGLDISKYYHYGYGSSICTVFTNPIHNYAAIHAQRQLSTALKGEEQESENFDEIDKIARHCNFSQLSKRAAEQDSKKLYIAAYIYRQCLSTDEKKLLVKAVVIGLNEESIDLYIPVYDLDITVPMNERSLPHAQSQFNSKFNEFTIFWDKNYSDKLAFLSEIHIQIQVDMKEIRPIFEIELTKS